jgi:O-antigen/teichoic acid export membrane protein
MVLLWADMLLLGYLGTSADVGYYGAALRVGTGSSAILMAFATVFTPVIADLYNKRHLTELQTLYKTVARWIFTCSLPIFIVVILLAEPVMHLFGSDFTAGSGALMLLAFSQLINAGTGTAGLMVLMSGHSQMELLNVAAALIVDVALCFLLIPSFGVIGAAVANVSAAGVINLLRAAEVWIFLRLHAYNLDYIKPIFAGAIGALVVYLGNLMVSLGTGLAALLMSAAILMVVYVALTVALGLNKHDKMVVRMVKARLTRVEST